MKTQRLIEAGPKSICPLCLIRRQSRSGWQSLQSVQRRSLSLSPRALQSAPAQDYTSSRHRYDDSHQSDERKPPKFRITRVTSDRFAGEIDGSSQLGGSRAGYGRGSPDARSGGGLVRRPWAHLKRRADSREAPMATVHETDFNTPSDARSQEIRERAQSLRGKGFVGFREARTNKSSSSSAAETSSFGSSSNAKAANVPSPENDAEDRMHQRAQRLASMDVQETPSYVERSRQQMVSSANRRAQKFASREDDDAPNRAKEERLRREKRNQRKKDRAERAVREAPIPIELPPFISVQNLATTLRVRPEDFVRKLEDLGFEEIAMDHVLNSENAGLVAMEYNYEPIFDRGDIDDLKARAPAEDKTSLPPRPPVVTIMGHVDHGKTTILDYMRKSSVAATEHGGITQHIGAFSVPMSSDKLITFLDTPGHAAFLSMRQRGANVTDIVILVVAADDSVKPQTIEAIKHAKAAKVPIIVAINKVDKDEADIERVKQDLLRHEIEVEDYGGDIQAVPVSGKTGQGIDNLIEAMDSQAEVLDLRAEADGAAEGWILEAEIKKAGRVATVLVRRGTLKPGDIIVAGMTWARIRSLRNEAGVAIPFAGPGTPAEIDGWREQPVAGDEVLQAPDEQTATTAIEYRLERAERAQAAIDMEAINEARRLNEERQKHERQVFTEARQTVVDEEGAIGFRRAHEAGMQAIKAARDAVEAAAPEQTVLHFIVKADVGGSTEAVAAQIAAIPVGNQPLEVSVLRSGVGLLSESDVALAASIPDGCGILVNFNQQVPPHIMQTIDKAGIQLLDDNIIYRVTDGVRAIVEAKLPPIVTKRVLGEVEIAQPFEIRVGKKTMKIAGCKVRNGVINRTQKVRVFRGAAGNDKNVVFEGHLSSLKNQKKDVQEMRKGTECGIAFENWSDFAVGDVIQAYEEHHEKRRLAA